MFWRAQEGNKRGELCEPKLLISGIIKVNKYKNMSPDPFEKFRKALEPKEHEVKLDVDFDSPRLEEALKDLSLEPSHLSEVLKSADRVKRKHPEKYEKEFKERVAGYYANLLDKAAKEWGASKKELPDYRNYMRQLYIFTLFESLIDRNVTPELVGELTQLEQEMRQYLSSHQRDLDAFLKGARSEAVDRSLTPPGFEEHAEKILELLTVASAKVKRVKRKGGPDDFLIKHDNEVWKFDLFGQLTLDESESLVVVRSKKDPARMAVMPLKRIIDFLEKDNFAGVVSIIDSNYEGETKYADLLAGFDLPKTGNIEHIRLTLDKFDPVITPTFFGSTVFAERLRQFYPNLQVGSPILTSKPKEMLRQRVRKAYDAGTRQFFVDLYAHGTEEKLLFGSGLEAADLTAIVKEFPDAKFYFSTIGCYGGGLREGFLQEMEREPELKQRMALFLQTKPDVPNAIQGRVLEKAGGEVKKVAPGELTLYQMALLKALSEGKTFGGAIIDADKESKVRMYLDPETIIEGQLITEFAREETDRLV